MGPALSCGALFDLDDALDIIASEPPFWRNNQCFVLKYRSRVGYLV
jgi:hypothetical protein